MPAGQCSLSRTPRDRPLHELGTQGVVARRRPERFSDRSVLQVDQVERIPHVLGCADLDRRDRAANTPSSTRVSECRYWNSPGPEPWRPIRLRKLPSAANIQTCGALSPRSSRPPLPASRRPKPSPQAQRPRRSAVVARSFGPPSGLGHEVRCVPGQTLPTPEQMGQFLPAPRGPRQARRAGEIPNRRRVFSTVGFSKRMRSSLRRHAKT